MINEIRQEINLSPELEKKIDWVKNISRLGVLKYDSKNDTYTIENFGTGW